MIMVEGTADFYNWPDKSFDEMDSTLYSQQNITDCPNTDKILEPPEGQDEDIWKSEPLRQFCLQLSGLAVKLQSECHPDAYAQMTQTEQWIFSLYYTRHTLDSTVCLLNKKLQLVCHRIYRICSRDYFHHWQIFDEYENEIFLCHLFTKFVMKHNLMSKDNLIVPILEEEVQNSVSRENEA
uniref:MOB-like protein phocein n=1 Tax=Microcebus murinus TaxID=30608 RepID=A0A8C5XVV6_MICMU